MNSELAHLASTLQLSAPESRELALKFSLACAKRIEHLLEEPEVIKCLGMLERYVAGKSSSESLAKAAEDAAKYCAYASVYASVGYAAVADREAFETEFSWQLACLTSLAIDANIGAAGESRTIGA